MSIGTTCYTCPWNADHTFGKLERKDLWEETIDIPLDDFKMNPDEGTFDAL